MRIEVVHNQNHLLGILIPFFKHFSDKMRPVNLGPSFSDFYLSPPSKRFYLNKYVGNSIAYSIHPCTTPESLDRTSGHKLQEHLPSPLQNWRFGLAVFSNICFSEA